MTINEFFYWLQGYFEISGHTGPVSKDQCDLILRHIALVNVGRGGSPDAARLGKMRAILEFVLDGSMDASPATAKIRTEVSEQFIHVIDPQAGPAAQAHLNQIHAGGSSRPVMRC